MPRRCRQISHNTMGGTKKAWAKVPDRDQINTIAVAVSRYKNKIQASNKVNAARARGHDDATHERLLSTLGFAT